MSLNADHAANPGYGHLRPRIVDLGKMVPVSEVLGILDELVTAMASDDALEGNEWDGAGYLPADPSEVLAYARDRVDEARLQLLAVIP